MNGEIEGALIVAERTGYDLSVVEIIAPMSLREHFRLEDGNLVKLTYSGAPETCVDRAHA